MPLPLRPPPVVIKFIRSRDRHPGSWPPDVWFPKLRDRFAYAVAICVSTDHRPVASPFHRLQVDDAAISALVLKMNEPRFAGLGLDPGALMWSVDIGLALGQDLSR